MKNTNALENKVNRFFLNKNAPRQDLGILILVSILGIFGTLTVFSAGSAYAEFRYGDPMFFVKRQALWVLIGFTTMFFASRIKPQVYFSLTPYLYAITLCLLILVLAIGLVGNGAQRWISIGGLTIQPSEIAKMTIVMALSYYFTKNGERALGASDKKTKFLAGTLLPCIILAVPIILVMLQKHLSCIIILGIIGLLVIVASGTDTRYLTFFCIIGLICVSAIALFTDYTKERITVWRDPEAYKLTGGWQTLQGLMAIGSGGAFGVGYGNSLLKYCYVSEPANDMIYAILAEELGFFGAVCVLVLFAILVFRGYKLALRAENIFERLVIFGVFTKIATQTLLNVAVVTNSIPNTGISLPFFSYGGSSLVMLFFEMGIILSVSRYSRISK